MNTSQDEDVMFQMAGTLISLRLAISGLMATHPQPEELKGALQLLIQNSGFSSLPDPIRGYADQVMKEFLGSLDVNRHFDKSRQ